MSNGDSVPIPRDEKQYDSTPGGIRRTIEEIRGRNDRDGIVFHYTSGTNLELIEKGGILCSKGKEGGGLYFFRKGPDEYGFHGRKYNKDEEVGQVDPTLFEAFEEKLTLAARGPNALAELKAGTGSHDWLEWCLVCFVRPDNLKDMEDRAGSCMIPWSRLERDRGCERDQQDKLFIKRDAEGRELVDILGAIRIHGYRDEPPFSMPAKAPPAPSSQAVAGAAQSNTATMLHESLLSGAGVSIERANEVQRGLQALMSEPWADWWPEVTISYATGSRESIDSPGAGPGLLCAATIVHALHDAGIACASGLHVPPGSNWMTFLPKVGGRFAKCRVLIVLLTKPFYNSIPCLKEVHQATEAPLRPTIIPIRCDGAFPKKAEQWPQLERGDALMLEQVQSTLGAVNTLPPRGLFFDRSETMVELVRHVQSALGQPLQPASSLAGIQHASAQSPAESSSASHFMHIVLQPPPGTDLSGCANPLTTLTMTPLMFPPPCHPSCHTNPQLRF